LAFASCGTQTSNVSTRQDGRTSAENRLSLAGDGYSRELTEQTLSRLLNSRQRVSIKQVRYDTGRPIDTLTGRPPIVEEIDIVINTDTEIVESDSTVSKSHNRTTVSIDDISIAETDVRTETVSSKKSGLSVIQKTLMYAGIVLIIAVVIIIILKVKRWI
jgi:hypothetical protein